jgi:protoporphyrin/coproporphyrin ferrochelatase
LKAGVLLFNLGGPENLEEVRPFLKNLFSDPEIIRIKNSFLRRMLASFIASIRERKSRNLYRQIGGGSPLRKITEAQAAALGAALSSRGFAAQIYVGMRCWNPSIDEAVEHILRDGISRLVLLPLFPQYSVATTGSCLKHFQALDRKFGLSINIDISTIRTWFDDPLYVEALASQIRETAGEFSENARENIHLLYSAHSIPVRYIDEGDPYPEQIRQSVALINERLGNPYPSTLAFQSKLGPVKWLGPATSDVLKELGKKENPAVLVIPISFVSDHIETLQEIDIAYREIALRSGIREFRRVPSLNQSPGFIDALANLVIKSSTNSTGRIDEN